MISHFHEISNFSDDNAESDHVDYKKALDLVEYIAPLSGNLTDVEAEKEAIRYIPSPGRFKNWIPWDVIKIWSRGKFQKFHSVGHYKNSIPREVTKIPSRELCWKFMIFLSVRFCCEINFENSRNAKSAIFKHLEAQNFYFYAFLHFLKAKI